MTTTTATNDNSSSVKGLDDLARRLALPFEPEDVDWRVGSTTKDKTKGMALAYIDARAVMRRLDDVLGPFGWQAKYSELRGGKIIVCSLGVRVPGGDAWIWKEDGAGDTAVEAEKGSLSDAFKRAAVRWGIGRYLYDLPSPWVKLNERGNGIDTAELPRLRKVAADALAGAVTRAADELTQAEAARLAHEELAERARAASGATTQARPAEAPPRAAAAPRQASTPARQPAPGPGLRRQAADRPPQGGGEGPRVAHDAELDGKWGDPLVRFDPRSWKGRSYVGAHYSQTEPAFLDCLAAEKEKSADSPRPGKEQYAERDRKDAALARGWARRLRANAERHTGGGGYEEPFDDGQHDAYEPEAIF